jgi:signal transduction histidine kinase/CheY-like chemotaxis protein
MATTADITGTRSEDPIYIERIRSTFRTSFPGLTTTYLTVIVLTWGLVRIDAATTSRAIVFLTIMSVQTIARMLLFRAYTRREKQIRNWRTWGRAFAAGTFAGGLTLGSGSVWIVSTQPVELQLIALLVVFACTGGAVGAFGSFLPAFAVFLFAIATPPSLWLLIQSDGFHLTIGGLVVIWALAVAEQARRASHVFTESIRLRLENIGLVENLRREKAVAEEANVAKSRFLASASHDLRQPVHALSVFVGAMRSHEMDAQARGLLDHIEGSVRALSGLFGGLLDISRLDAGVVGVKRNDFAIQPIIERVCRDYAAQAREKGLLLESQPCAAIVHSDPALCERILRNMVANAVTYTDRGKVLVGCRRGPQLRLQVWDTGRGIPPSEQQRVFQEFYQIGNPERDRTRGVGLGLAIVKRLTTLLEHRLELRSWPGKGTCFSIDIPYASNQSGAYLDPLQVTTVPTASGSGLILVVDDEGAIQIAMRSLLSSWGYSVIAAGSYAQMLERIGSNPEIPRLIICDYRLRDNETGSTVIERLRNEYNDTIPGMLITGDTAPDRIKEAQSSGYLLLHKPVSNAVLRASIASLLSVH